MKIDFRVIEQMLEREMLARDMPVERIKGDLFLIARASFDEVERYHSLTAIAEGMARELEGMQ